MKTRNRVVCFVGPSGVGKTSFAKHLINKHLFAMPKVVTTRQQRIDDDDRYEYVTEQRFQELITRDTLLEWDKYSDYYYGTKRQSMLTLANAKHLQGVILDLTSCGCMKVKKVIPSAIIIALLPDEPTWLLQRLKERNSQSYEEIATRTALLQDYLNEIRNMDCEKVFVAFSPASWEKTFVAIEKIVFKKK